MVKDRNIGNDDVPSTPRVDRPTGGHGIPRYPNDHSPAFVFTTRG